MNEKQYKAFLRTWIGIYLGVAIIFALVMLMAK